MSEDAGVGARQTAGLGARLRASSWIDRGLLALLVGLVVVLACLAGGVKGAAVVAAVCLAVMLQAVYALGLSVVVGSTGLLDLGYASFVAIGAFTVSLGLVLTDQEATAFPALPVADIQLTQEQSGLAPAEGEPVVVRRRRSGGGYDCVEGARAVRAAQVGGRATIAATHVSGLTLPVGQRVAKGTRPFKALPGGFFVLLLLAGGAGAMAGVVRGFPTLRLTGDYYAIVTLGFAEIVLLVAKNEEWLTGGAFGIKLPADVRPVVLGTELYNDTWQYFAIVLCALLATIVALTRLQSSRLGRTWAAIKADETAARSSGIDVDRQKTLAFATSGFVGGVAGGLSALMVGVVTPTQYGIDLSILCVSCLVLGGLGSLRGALVGAALLASLNEALRFAPREGDGFRNLMLVVAALALGLSWRVGRGRGVAVVGGALAVLGGLHLAGHDVAPRFLVRPEARPLVYGLLLILVMRFRPQGLLPPVSERPAPTQDELGALRAARTALFHIDQAAPPPGSGTQIDRAGISERLRRLRESDGGPEPSKGDAILEVRGLGKSFGGLRAVNDLSFDVARGSITALIGPNGAGKTTAFNMVTGVIPPTDGEVRLEGVELAPLHAAGDGGVRAIAVGAAALGVVALVAGLYPLLPLVVLGAVLLARRRLRLIAGLRPDEVCRLGVARTFQNIRLFEDQRVIDNVKVGLHRRLEAGLWSALLRTRRARAEEADAETASARYLDFAGLLPRMNDCAGALSYGERRRLEIARALASQPRLLLLDEPAAGMNPQETVELMALIRRIRAAGITVFLIEHDMKLVMEISDTIYVLDHGEEISRGTPAVVRADPRVIKAYLGVPD